MSTIKQGQQVEKRGKYQSVIYSVKFTEKKDKICNEVGWKISTTPWLIGGSFSSLITVRKKLNLVILAFKPHNLLLAV